jgi:hypothetical protein
MQLLAFCASAVGVGILLLIGFLVTARELLSESILGAPQEPDEEAGRIYTNQDRDGVNSGRVNPAAARRRHEPKALQR